MCVHKERASLAEWFTVELYAIAEHIECLASAVGGQQSPAHGHALLTPYGHYAAVKFFGLHVLCVVVCLRMQRG